MKRAKNLAVSRDETARGRFALIESGTPIRPENDAMKRHSFNALKQNRYLMKRRRAPPAPPETGLQKRGLNRRWVGKHPRGRSKRAPPRVLLP